MPTLIATIPTGETLPLDALEGLSLMETLRDIGAVDAVCGGGGACGTCAVRIAASWHRALPLPDDAERMMLEALELPLPEGRLSCQIIVSAALDGLELEVLPQA